MIYKMSQLFTLIWLFSQTISAHALTNTPEKDEERTTGPCNRTASVNSREIMLDLGARKKGEGLRYYFNQDPKAKYYLDQYQKTDDFFWYSAALGTLGTVTALVGMGRPGSFEGPRNAQKRILMISGVTLILVNFFVVKTLEYNNEKYLLKAKEEYNKRNWPKIYFGPVPDEGPQNSGHTTTNRWGVGAGLTTQF